LEGGAVLVAVDIRHPLQLCRVCVWLWDWLSHISTVELLLEALVIPLWARFVVELWVIKLRFCVWVPFLFLHMLTAFCMGVPTLHVGKVDFPFPP
jgi:hypothetical protein